MSWSDGAGRRTSLLTRWDTMLVVRALEAMVIPFLSKRLVCLGGVEESTGRRPASLDLMKCSNEG